MCPPVAEALTQHCFETPPISQAPLKLIEMSVNVRGIADGGSSTDNLIKAILVTRYEIKR